jgi:hypothetical protein
MISQVFKTKIPLEHGKKTKYRVRIVSNDCAINTEEYVTIKNWLLKQIAEDPTLTQTGFSGFQSLKMEHNGKNWEIVCETVADEKTE